MSRKNKTESSYANMFKHKTETQTSNFSKIEEKKKGINFDDLEDWQPNSANKHQNLDENQMNHEENENNIQLSSNNRQLKVQEIVQSFGIKYNKQISGDYNSNSDQYQVYPKPINQIPNQPENFSYSDNIYQHTIPINKLHTNKISNVIPQQPIAEHDDYSVNTSIFTNRQGEGIEKMDKIELSNIHNVMSDHAMGNTNIPNKKMANFIVNSNENFTPTAIQNKNHYDVIDENEEEDLKFNHSLTQEIIRNQQMESPLKYNLAPRKDSNLKPEEKSKNCYPTTNYEKFVEDDSLDDDNFSLNLNDDLNVTKNQLDDMNKELKDINRQIKNKEKQDEVDKKNETIGKNKKNLLEPILNTRMNTNSGTIPKNGHPSASDENKINIQSNNSFLNKPKRKQSPYLRNVNLSDAKKNVSEYSINHQGIAASQPINTVNNNNNITKPISIQTYQQNTNIMHIQPPLVGNLPVYYNQPLGNGYIGDSNLNVQGYSMQNVPNVANAQYHQMNMMNYPHMTQVSQVSQYPYQQINYPQNSNINMLPISGLMPSNYQYSMPIGNNVVALNNVHSINNLKSPSNKISSQITMNKVQEDSSSFDMDPEKKHMKLKPESNIVNYKPKTLKDYKEKFNSNDPQIKRDSGGLGANIGTKEWQEKLEKKNKMKEYSHNIKSMNKLNLVSNEEKNHNIKEIKSNSNQLSKVKSYKLKSENSEISVLKNKNSHKSENYVNQLLDDSLSFLDKKLEKGLNGPEISQRNVFTPDSSINRTGYSHIHNIRKLKVNHQEKNEEFFENVNNVNFTPLIEASQKMGNSKKPQRPKSSSKINTNRDGVILNPKNKIYTTLNQVSVRGEKNINHNSNKSSNMNYQKTGQAQNLNTSNLTSPNLSKLDNSRIRPTSSRPKKPANSNLEELINNHNFYNDKVEKIRNFINKY